MKKLSVLFASACLAFAACDSANDFELDPVEDLLCDVGAGAPITLTTNAIVRTLTNGKSQFYLTGQDLQTGFIRSLIFTIEPSTGNALPGVAPNAPVVIDLAAAAGTAGFGVAASPFVVKGSLNTPNGVSFNRITGGTMTITEANGTSFKATVANVTFERALTATTPTTPGFGAVAGPATQACPLVVEGLPIALDLRQTTPATPQTPAQSQPHTGQTTVRGGTQCQSTPRGKVCNGN